MNANYSQTAGRRARTPVRALLLLLALVSADAAGALHAEHSLRYSGWMGFTPVTVEVTLRKRDAGLYEYREWIAPRWWAAALGDPTARRTLMRIDGANFRPVAHEPGEGDPADLENLEDDAFDLLSVRLEARADIAAGRDGALYRVWQDDGTMETWTLELTGTAEIQTPDARYQALTFRLGNTEHWIAGWSAPLLAFHFVRLEFWEDGDRRASLDLEAKELWD